MIERKMTREEKFMSLAIEQAKIAYEKNEVPVGAVLVHNDAVIAVAHNTREEDKNALCHAEIIAINKGCEVLGGWRLHGCELYVTLEPCPMCAGAIINSRISKVYYGAKDAKAGCFGSLIDMTNYPFNHKPTLTGGVLESECRGLLSEFFVSKRK